MSARTIEVVFRFRSPVARPAYPVHLDAVLLYANAPSPDLEPRVRAQLDAAVATVGDGEDRVYCCSAIEFSPTELFTRFNTRRFDVMDFAEDVAAGLVPAKLSTKIDTDRGEVKGQLADIPMMWCSGARAYARIKDAEAFEVLLLGVRQIGKFGRLGYGALSAIEYDLEVAVDDDAWMRRVLPFEVPGAAQIRATVSPPYWDRTRIRPAFLHPGLL